ncbi:MAG: hypothetical protein AAGG50_08245 [Bacteroidota bacterium]
MLAFILFFAAVVVPVVLITGLLLIAMRPPTGNEPLIVHYDHMALPAYAAPASPPVDDPHVRVPSSLIAGTTWDVHLN